MNKKHVMICLACICLVFLVLLFLDYDSPGISDNVQIRIGPSERFTQEEIESAAAVVVSEFDIMNRELVYLWYDEAISNRAIAETIIEDINKDTVIILFSTITVINPNIFSPADVDDFGWLLVRDVQSGEWELYAAGLAGVTF